MSEESWSRGVYESGWNARQLLSHIASMSGTAGFVLSMARMPSAASLGAGFDEDGFNARLVAEREGKSTAELLGEIKGNFERDVEAVRAAPDELIRKQFRAPWESRAGWGTSSWSHSKGTWACISWTCVSQSTRCAGTPLDLLSHTTGRHARIPRRAAATVPDTIEVRRICNQVWGVSTGARRLRERLLGGAPRRDARGRAGRARGRGFRW